MKPEFQNFLLHTIPETRKCLKRTQLKPEKQGAAKMDQYFTPEVDVFKLGSNTFPLGEPRNRWDREEQDGP